jgi:hypothetical protein
MLPNRRRWLLILVSILLLAGMVSVLFVVTRREAYCELTVIALDINEDYSRIQYKVKGSVRTWVTAKLLIDGGGNAYVDCWDVRRGWARLPHESSWTGEAELDVPLYSSEERRMGKTITDKVSRKKSRVLVSVGTTYVIREDEPLMLYRFTTPSGQIHEGRIEVSPSDPRPFFDEHLRHFP